MSDGGWGTDGGAFGATPLPGTDEKEPGGSPDPQDLEDEGGPARHDRSEVCTRALPIEQPPAQAAPIPMRMPPMMERWITWALGTRTRNSPEALAAM